MKNYKLIRELEALAVKWKKRANNRPDLAHRDDPYSAGARDSEELCVEELNALIERHENEEQLINTTPGGRYVGTFYVHETD